VSTNNLPLETIRLREGVGAEVKKEVGGGGSDLVRAGSLWVTFIWDNLCCWFPASSPGSSTSSRVWRMRGWIGAGSTLCCFVQVLGR